MTTADTNAPLQRRLAYLSLQATTEGQAAHAHVYGIADGLRKLGWHVDVFEPTYESARPGIFERLREWGRVQRRMRAELAEADVVYMRSHFASLPTALAAMRRGIPFVQEVNGTWEDMYLAWPWTRYIARFFIAAVRAQWKRASALVVVTQDLADWAVKEAGRDVPARTIPNAADTNVFGPEGNVPAGLPSRYVVFVGALAAWQGLPTLIDATREPGWPGDVHAVIVGDGVERSTVMQAMRDGLPVTYLGRLPYHEVPGVIRGSIAALSPQNAGGGRSNTGLSPVKVYEALACDVPVIVTDYPGQADLVRDMRCGLVVEPENPAELASAVARLAADPDAARGMGRRGGGAVRRWHSWDSRAAQTDDLLRPLAVRRSSYRVVHRMRVAARGMPSRE